MKINWKQKLSSRKFWALIVALVLATGTLLGAGDETLTKVAGLITALGAVVAYTIAETVVDSARIGADAEKEVERMKLEDYSDGYDGN